MPLVAHILRPRPSYTYKDIEVCLFRDERAITGIFCVHKVFQYAVHSIPLISAGHLEYILFRKFRYALSHIIKTRDKRAMLDTVTSWFAIANS
jgi:hypothetical protein